MRSLAASAATLMALGAMLHLAVPVAHGAGPQPRTVVFELFDGAPVGRPSG
jgi:hypothetical protein